MSQLSEAVTRAWYQNEKWIWLLLPLTILFWLVSTLRRIAYQRGWKASVKVTAPVVIVGNISVGGTGKSPLTAYLVSELTKKGYRPGVVSRGYGGQSDHYPLIVNQDSSATTVGDEPLMLFQMTQCPVAVDPVRSRAAQMLCEKYHCDVVICDDGLQHYALARDIEICVVDGKRLFGNGLLLPSGPLRESTQRLRHLDYIVVNSGDHATNELEQSGLRNHPAVFDMSLKPQSLINVFNGSTWGIAELKGKAVHGVAGIGNPERFFKALEGLGADVSCHGFPDHHQFSRHDFTFDDGLPVVMTHKDAVKCSALYGKMTPDNFWYMPVSADINDEFIERLCQQLDTVSKE